MAKSLNFMRGPINNLPEWMQEFGKEFDRLLDDPDKVAVTLLWDKKTGRFTVGQNGSPADLIALFCCLHLEESTLSKRVAECIKEAGETPDLVKKILKILARSPV